MVDDVVVRQRLLDQEEVEIVERPENVDVIQRVRRVRVDLERQGRMTVPDRLDDPDIPPRRDLELDPAIPLVDEAIDLIEQDAEVVLDPQADAGDDLAGSRPGASASETPRDFARASQAAISRPGLREVVPLHRAEEADQVFDRPPIAADDLRGEEVPEDVPAGLGRLRAIIRVGRAGGFAPPPTPSSSRSRTKI